MNKIKAGDTVVIIAGKDKFTKNKKNEKVPTTGKVIKVYPTENRVLVEGVNKVKKHMKASQSNKDGGIYEQEAPIHISNVMMLDPKDKVPTRVGFKFVENKKVRYAKKSGTILDK